MKILLGTAMVLGAVIMLGSNTPTEAAALQSSQQPEIILAHGHGGGGYHHGGHGWHGNRGWGDGGYYGGYGPGYGYYNDGPYYNDAPAIACLGPFCI
jgi:hypothetical protein